MTRDKLLAYSRRWGPALLVMATIFVVSSIPSTDIPQYEGFWDFVVKKGGHLFGYGLLAVLLLRGIAQTRAQGGAPLARRDYLAAFVLAVLYGATDELHQRFTPGRGAHLADVGIDALGACLGLAFHYGWRVIRQTRTQSPPSQSIRRQP
jgi:VanZ family protein